MLIGYFKRSHASQIVDLNGYSDLLVKMSPECHRIIAMRSHIPIITAAGFFSNFGKHFLSEIVLLLRPVVFAKREKIIKPYQRADNIYFLSKGMVFHDLRMLRYQGDVFGEEAILTFGVYQTMATALTCEFGSVVASVPTADHHTLPTQSWTCCR